jgi:dephospho-CoA kinase
MPTNKIILGFVGDLASGKGTICQYLKEKHSVTSYRFSTMLRDMLDRIYIEKSRENLQDLSTFLRSRYGQDIMSKVIVKDVLNDKKETVAVEGIRRPTDITYLKELEGFHLIYITAEPNIRWQRMVLRKENPDEAEKTFEQFLKDEQAEADMLIKELGKQAEYTLTNNGTKEEFYLNMESILKSIKHEN